MGEGPRRARRRAARLAVADAGVRDDATLDARIRAQLQLAYSDTYRCPGRNRAPDVPKCEPWFSFRWLSRWGEPGRIAVWVSCATAEIDDQFELNVSEDGDLLGDGRNPISMSNERPAAASGESIGGVDDPSAAEAVELRERPRELSPAAVREVRVAVIGAGYWGPNLIRNLAEAPGGRVVAVCDLSRERLDLMRQRYPYLRTTRDHRELITATDIDAVCIATPVSTHASLAIEALRAGKHVLIEKPLAPSVAEAERIATTAREQQRVLMVGHTFVYNPAVMKVHELVRSGEIGDVYYVDSQRVNLGLHQFDINVLWDLGPHDVSIILRWLEQEPDWIACSGACYAQPDIEDVAFLSMGFPSGALAHVHLSWLAPGKRRTTTVIGSKKMVVYDDVESVEKVKVYDQGVAELVTDGEELRRSYRAGDIFSPRLATTEALQLEARHFIDCVREGRRPLTDGEAGVRVVRVLEAAMRSLRIGGIRVPYRLTPIASEHSFITPAAVVA